MSLRLLQLGAASSASKLARVRARSGARAGVAARRCVASAEKDARAAFERAFEAPAQMGKGEKNVLGGELQVAASLARPISTLLRHKQINIKCMSYFFNKYIYIMCWCEYCFATKKRTIQYIPLQSKCARPSTRSLSTRSAVP